MFYFESWMELLQVCIMMQYFRFEMPDTAATANVNAKQIFTQLLNNDSEKSTGLAAIETLMEVLKASDGEFLTVYAFK